MKTAVLAASVLLVAASAASAAPVLDGLPLHVSPLVGRPHATFRLEYTEPANGLAGETRTDVVRLTGPGGAGCISSESVSEPVAAPGSEVIVRLRPTGGRGWCVGTFAGRVEETIRPRCQPGQMCPMFVALVPIGHFRFVVRH